MMLATWKLIANIGRINTIPASAIILVIIPIIAKLSDAETQNITGIASFIISLLDTKVAHIPINMLRVFWISFFIMVSSFLFRVFCPEIIKFYKDYDEWRKESESSAQYEMEHIEAHGEKGKTSLENELHNKYLELLHEQNRSNIVTRFIITTLLILSMLLTIRITIDQFLNVIYVTNWKELMFW